MVSTASSEILNFSCEIQTYLTRICLQKFYKSTTLSFQKEIDNVTIPSEKKTSVSYKFIIIVKRTVFKVLLKYCSLKSVGNHLQWKEISKNQSDLISKFA